MSNTPSKRFKFPAIWVLLVTAVLVLATVVWQQRGDHTTADGNNSATGLGRGAKELEKSVLAQTLDDLSTAAHRRNRNAFLAAAGDSSVAKSWAAQTYDNLQELQVAKIDFDIVSEQMVGQAKDGTYRAKVNVRWKPGAGSGLPREMTDPVTVNLGVRLTGDFVIESATPTNDPMPLWLEGALDVRRSDRRTIVRVDGGTDVPQLDRMLARATADVREVYGRRGSDALIVIPSAGAQSTDLVGGNPARLSQIAAITTTLDGSSSSNAPTGVVLNPDVFTPMGSRAAQIVLTHEVTHDVTGATTAVAPLWVSEGYADYVAMNRDQMDPTRSASQILRRVRQSGPPKRLPSDDAFGMGRAALGATYESAWMVFRMLGETYDEQSITDFYRRVLRGADTDVAARDVFGLSLREITVQWRQYLRVWAQAAP